MYKGHTIGVVIPAYNEEGFVGTVIETMPTFVDRIYVIDDCSTDDTWEEILQYASADAARESRSFPDDGTITSARVIPIRHRKNRGAGGGIKTGYLHALADSMDVTVTVDADGQMDPDLMTRFLNPIVKGEADYAKGNRLANTEYRAEMPTFRLVGNWMLTVLTKIASGYWKTTDPQNGYTAISHEALSAVDVAGMYEYYGYCNDLLVKLNVEGMRVADVAMPATYGDEESSIQYGSYVPKVSSMLFQNFLWRLKARYLDVEFHPLALCYALGILSAFASVVYAIATVSEAVSFAPIPFSPAGSLLFLLVGSLFTVTAALLDRQENENLVVIVE